MSQGVPSLSLQLHYNYTLDFWELIALWPENNTCIKFCFLNSFPQKIHFSYKMFFEGNSFPENDTSRIRSLVIQRVTWKNVLGIIFLKNLISVT